MKIQELINKTGFSRRTIYYYTQIGLLPPPEGKGKTFHYTEEHVRRLETIRRLQQARYSLKEIKQLLHETQFQSQSNQDQIPLVKQAPDPYGRFLPTPIAKETIIKFELGDGITLMVRVPLTSESYAILREHFPEILKELEPHI